MDEKYTGLKKQLSELCGLKPEQILLAEVHSSNIKVRRKKKKFIIGAPHSGIFVCYMSTAACCFILLDPKLWLQ